MLEGTYRRQPAAERMKLGHILVRARSRISSSSLDAFKPSSEVSLRKFLANDEVDTPQRNQPRIVGLQSSFTCICWSFLLAFEYRVC
jgi:hypothetical protein